MHIVNIMLSRNAGGIEQALVDYCEGLRQRGHEVTAITHPHAFINDRLRPLGIRIEHLRNLGEWDPLAARRLKAQLAALNPAAVIAHTGRAFALARKAACGRYPLVGVAHNYNKRIRRFAQADAAFAVNHDLLSHLHTLGVAKERIFHIPNMVRCHELPHRPARRKPPVIGAMGRFVPKKGFDVYIDALALLRQRGYHFRAILGGSGAEEKRLKKQAAEAGLGDMLSFPGWVEDKKGFYQDIDLFCLPSLHEPFGIVLLEAFVHGVPVISTDSEGPRDLITPNFNAVMVPMGDRIELADAMARLLDGEHHCDELAANAFVKAKTNYCVEAISERIEKALLTIITRWRMTQTG